MKKIPLFLVLFVLVIACLGVNAPQETQKKAALTYPATKKVDASDDYHGTKVADPYRWLEDDNAPDVKEWVIAQNKVTFGYLDQIPNRSAIRQRLEQLYNYPRYSAPFRVGKYYFFTKNDGLQNQSVYYFQKGLEGEAQVFLDPNTLSKDGTVRIGLIGASQDDRYLAFSRSEAGSDWQEIRVMEIASRRELADRLRWVKFSGAAWDGRGFYYSRYDAPKPGEELSGKNQFQKIFYHRLGDPQAKDRLIYEEKEHPLRYCSADVTEDGRYLILGITEGTQGIEIRYKDLQKKEDPFHLLCPGFDSNYNVLNNIGDRFLVWTDRDAPNYRVVLIDPAKPEKENWQTVVAERRDVLENVNTAGDKLFCFYLKDVASHVIQCDLQGKVERQVSLPTVGTVYGLGGKKEDQTLFYVFSSFTYPPTIFRYDVASGESRLFRRSEISFNPEAYEARQVFYRSADGTAVPLFLVHKKGLALDGKRPTLLYAYGGFNSSSTPYFSPANLVLLERGGVYALACIRGGGEYGESWHRAGMLDKKQNVFDDFIAAAEYLISTKVTSPERLAIMGGSNGGLLVGACLTQRPDLFGVAIAQVGVMDMLRYHKYTVGWGWTVEYGSSDNPEQFKYLYAYSPLHRIRSGVRYPATLVTTADHDDRVVPAHSFKFIATLQECQAGDAPVLIRIETRSGHGSSSLTKGLDLYADMFAFMFYNMGIE